MAFPLNRITAASAATLGLAVAALGADSAAADPETPHPERSGTGKHCNIVLEPLRDGETVSKIKSKECFDTFAERQARIGNDTLLMIWYDNINYNVHESDDSTTVEGTDPCDREGYGISDVPFAWDWTISSYKVFNNCNKSTIFTEENYKGAPANFTGNVPYVGYTHNDDVESIRIWNQ